MAARRIWPGTAAEHRDRERVKKLVRRVGSQRLRFTIYDLQREMREDPSLRLDKAKDLSRHVHDLPRTLLRPAERRLAAADADLETGEVLAPPRLARHTWVLAERWTEYEQAPPELDDLERTLHALWVAYLAQGEDVPTRAVTDVLRQVKALAPEREEQTSLRLQTLAGRTDPLAVRVARTDERWVRWRPKGPEPTHPDLSVWVEAVRAINEQGGTRVGGHATLNEAVRELVVIAINATQTPEWPQGRPVMISDIRAQARQNPRAAELLDRLKRSGRSLRLILSEAVKPRHNGQARVRPRIVRLPRRLGERAYYDVPDLPGADHRALYLLERDFRRLTSSTELEAIGREWVASQRLASSPEETVRAVAAVRALSCWEEVRLIENALEELRPHRHRLAPRLRDSVDRGVEKYETLISRWGSSGVAKQAAAAAVARFGVEPTEMLSAARPLITAAELRDFVSPARRGRGSDAVFFSRLVALRRFPNPDHTNRADSDPQHAAVTCADRAEALVYLAEQSGAKTLGFLRRGKVLLGRSLRSPAVFRHMARSSVGEHRFSALAALALLGDASGAEIALEWLHNPRLPVLDVECALYALLVLRRVDLNEWPAHLRTPKDPAVQKVWRDVITAVRQKRWLL